MKKRVIFVLLILFCMGKVMAQNISGVVYDTNNEPLPGVTVVIKGMTKGSITDLNGKFSISVPDAAKKTLVFSYIGFLTIEKPIGVQKEISVVLQEDTKKLEEVVVVGYGTQKKSVVTAAISSVSAEQLANETPTRIEDVMKGHISGVQITQSSGQPNSDSKVRIRGIGSVNNSEPLYIVDGMVVGGGINYLNPTDIKSIEILKDAASGAIYGARAANGVVLVTTKAGSAGKATVSYDVSYGWQNPWKKEAVLNAQQYMTIMNEMDVNDGNAPRYSSEYMSSFKGKGTDWQKEVFNKNAPIMQHQVNVSGGNDKASYFLSAGYLKNEGIIGGNYGRSNYQRYSLRSNTTFTVFEDKTRNFLNSLKVGENVGYSRDESTSIEANSEYGSILGDAIAFSPLIPVYASDDDGAAILATYPTALSKNGKVFSLPPVGYQELANPMAMLNRPNKSLNNSDKIVASFYGELNILPGLKFRTTYGVDLAFWGNDSYSYKDYLGSMQHTDRSTVSSTMNRGFRWQVDNVLTYNKTFADKHNITVVLGQEANRYNTRNLSGTDYDLLDTDPSKANINYAIADRADERVTGGTNGFDNESMASYFGRLDYNFDERYMAEGTVRRDGSSRFGTNNKWAVFPSFSLGWNVLNEPYLQSIKPSWFNVMKIRASWGQNGNDNIGNFLYRSLMDGGENYYFGGSYDVVNKANTGTMVYGSSPGAIANPDIKWETSTQTDLGVDLRLFNSRFNFSFDYYNKDTKDMLATMPVPVYIGQSSPTGNLGKMNNWGLEFEVGWKNSYKDFSYSVRANLSYAKNKLIDLGNASGETTYESAGASGVGDYVHAKNGEVWPYFYGYKTAGIFQNWDEVNSYKNAAGGLIQPKAHPGDVRFVDLDGNGSIGSGDRTKIGKGMPDWTYSFNLNAQWKGFDLGLLFQGTIGNDIFDFAQRGDVPAMNRPSWILDRWMGEGTSNKIPRMTSANPNGNWASSDLYIHNGSYLRLKTAQFGYTLPQNLTKKVSVQRLRFYIAAENLITVTGYEGFDPELAAGSYTTLGVDKGIYPQSRTISVGANITF
jgi:TonB-linked SusC/RagA family outer membrane protein